MYSITGTNLLSRIDGEFLLCDIGDNYRIRWNVNNFEVVGNYTNYPASVTWYGAMAFASFYGYDLPTEAEWEKAARGSGSNLYPWGNTVPDVLPMQVNQFGMGDDGHRGCHLVGSLVIVVSMPIQSAENIAKLAHLCAEIGGTDVQFVV